MSRILPILFNTDMVRAILDGRKTVTRRIIKDNVAGILNSPYHKEHPEVSDRMLLKKLCRAPYQLGDILYVRETWGIANFDYDEEVVYIVYKASENEKDEGCRAVKFPDDKFEKFYDFMSENSPEWRPSIHMPKEAARIWIKVTDVRVERLCSDIREADCIKEGISPYKSDMTEKTEIEIEYEFEDLWNSTIKKSDYNLYGFDVDPWVWVIEFEQCEKPEGN